MDIPTLKLVALVVFLLSTLFVFILSIILNYHWTNYSIDTASLKKIRFVYLLITSILFFLTIALFLNTLTS
ncbi:MAG: hypothetical protein HZA36_00600 [Parcubacteria group bacterium]|nr:hypothetical protein [Parcubacteria group bacterium]